MGELAYGTATKCPRSGGTQMEWDWERMGSLGVEAFGVTDRLYC